MNRITYSLILLPILLLAGCTTPQTNEPTPFTQTAEDIHHHDLFLLHAQKNNQTLEETRAFFQQTYEIQNENTIFQNLPTPPTTFNEHLQVWKGGDTNALLQVPPETYLQPEFYPTFQETGLNAWINAPNPPAAAMGIMSIPAEQETTIPPEETTIEAALYIGSAWGTTYYQGMGLRYTLEPKTPHTLTITPANILVGPTFPLFSKNWMKRIQIQGTITPTPGVKTYTLRLFPATPTVDLENQWAYTQTPYVRADTTLINPEGLATLTIHVQEE